MVPKARVKLDYYEGALTCPECGNLNLHQGKVEIWNRDEDEASGNHIVVEGDNILGDTDMSKNPSRRRQGLAIHFRCEYCSYDLDDNDEGKFNGKEFVLKIIQHKGTTYMSWKGNE